MNTHFQEVEVVYFDSYLSKKDEELGLVNSSNVQEKIPLNEFSVVNDASLHSQVLFIASGCLAEDSFSLKYLSPDKIHRLNSIPHVKRFDFVDDELLLAHCSSSSCNTFFMTSKLMASSRENLWLIRCVLLALMFTS